MIPTLLLSLALAVPGGPRVRAAAVVTPRPAPRAVAVQVYGGCRPVVAARAQVGRVRLQVVLPVRTRGWGPFCGRGR
jgi:hypothetical protein